MAKFTVKVIHIENATEKESEIELRTDEKFSFGRGDKCEFPIFDPKLSRNHFYLLWTGQKLCVTDNQSTNGSSLNGMELKSTQFVNAGDRIEVGSHVVQVLKFPQTSSDSK